MSEPAARPDLSVIIVNWNTRALLAACLASLAASTDSVAIECIVVDNGSTDGSVEMVRRDFPEVVLIEAGENLGFARANNRGMARASGRSLLLLNSDTLVHAGAPAALVRAAAAFPEAGVIGCRLLNADGSLQASWAAFPTPASEVRGRQDRRRTLLPPRAELGNVYSVDWVGGAALLTRPELVAQIGGLDEAIFMYTEETDFCYRARAAGHQVLYLEEATITHLGGGSGSRSSAAQLIHLYESKLYYMRKHHGPWAEGLLRGGLAARQTLLIARAAARSLFGRGQAHEATARRALLRQLLAGYAHRN